MPEPHDQQDIMRELEDIKQQLSIVLDGNGRAGIREIADAVFGRRVDGRPLKVGLTSRVESIEKSVEALARQRKETVVLQRGIAIGVGLVALDVVFGLDLTKYVAALFGAS